MGIDRSPAEVENDALERAVRTALAVDPSPAFLARVRVRIANEPPPSRWPIRSPVIASAIAVVIVAALVFTAKRPAPATTGTTTTVPVTPIVQNTVEPEARTTVPDRADATSARHGRRRLRPASGTPDVLLTEDMRAFRAVLHGVNTGSITVGAVAGPTNDAEQQLAVSSIAIPAIAIDPLPTVTE